MGAPQAEFTKLAIHEEAVWADGVRTMFDASNAYRLYFDSFSPDIAREPINRDEIDGVNPIDWTEVVTGGITVTASMSFALRYSGIHSVILGWAMGSLLTSGAGPYVNMANIADNLSSLAFMYGPPDTINTVFDNWLFTGMMCSSLTISQQAGEPIIVTANMVGKAYDFDNDSAQAFPTYANGLPDQGVVEWHHLDATDNFDLAPDGGGSVTMSVESWEVTIDNNISPRFLVQDGRFGSQPQRNGRRTFSGSLVIEKDAAWEKCVEMLGITPDGATDKGDLQWGFNDPNSTAGTRFRLNQVEFTNTSPIVAGPGPLTETVSFRSHTGAGSTSSTDIDSNAKDPFAIECTTVLEGPAGTNPASWGAII